MGANLSMIIGGIWAITIIIEVASPRWTICIDCVENGSMTKDLAILIGPSSNYLTTNQFLDELDGQLKKKLN